MSADVSAVVHRHLLPALWLAWVLYWWFSSRDVKATLRPADKENDKAPDYRIFAGATEFGAAWKKTSKAEREYLSVKLDDPSFPAPIYASLVEAEDGESFSLIWSRRNGD